MVQIFPSQCLVSGPRFLREEVGQVHLPSSLGLSVSHSFNTCFQEVYSGRKGKKRTFPLGNEMWGLP